MMRQRSLRVFAGLLFVLLSSCGGEETAPSSSETLSPAATPPAPAATPVAKVPTVEPTQAQKPTTDLPPPPGLIKSTDPDARAKQQSNNSRTNPFVPAVPVPINSPTTRNNPSALPKLPEQSEATVASLPDLPGGIGPDRLPPQARDAAQRSRASAQNPLPRQGERGVPGLPELPVAIGPQNLPPRARPQGGSPLPNQEGRGVPGLPGTPPGIGPQLPPGSTGGNGNQGGGGQGGTQRATAPQPPSLPEIEERSVPGLPDLPVAIGPKLPPKAPNGEDIPKVPAQPDRSVPGLPELPVAIGPANLPPIPEPEVAAAPPPPQPDIARAVEVTGVVQVGSQTRIIVKAPDEPSSRYVQVGQRLSNGRVLVKRLEQSGGQPVVILEENGIEVAKAIGEIPTASAPTPTS